MERATVVFSNDSCKSTEDRLQKWLSHNNINETTLDIVASCKKIIINYTPSSQPNRIKIKTFDPRGDAEHLQKSITKWRSQEKPRVIDCLVTENTVLYFYAPLPTSLVASATP